MRWLIAFSILVGCVAPEAKAPPVPVDPGTPVPVESSTSSAPITTDRDHYTFTPGEHVPELTIRSTLTAPEDQRLYIVNCNGQFSPGLQALENGVWIDAWVGIVNQCLSAPIIIEPGASHDYEFVVSQGTGASAGGPRTDPPPGTYRVVWHSVLTTYDASGYPFGEPLPVELRASDPITIE